MITDKEFDFVSQNAHMVGGALAVLGPAALFGNTGAFWGGLTCLVFAAVKEFWYDEKYESAEVRGSGLRDFMFYALGVNAGNILLYLKGLLC